jgi:hypothetical protein
MRRYLGSFKRDGWGIWTCLEAVLLELPEGPIQVPVGVRLIVGSKYSGVDLAILLEAEHAKVARQARPD